MNIKKGYIIAIIFYIILCMFMRQIELKVENNTKEIKQVKKEVIEIKKENKDIKKEIKENKKEIEILQVNDCIRLKNGNKEQNEVVAYLWNKTKNIDLILTFYGESWLKSATINDKNTNGTIDYGYCQLNNAYHNDYIKSDNFKKMDSQLDYCIEVYNKAVKSGRIRTTFYAYNTRYSPRVRGQFWISQEAVDITYKK